MRKLHLIRFNKGLKADKSANTLFYLWQFSAMISDHWPYLPDWACVCSRDLLWPHKWCDLFPFKHKKLKCFFLNNSLKDLELHLMISALSVSAHLCQTWHPVCLSLIVPDISKSSCHHSTQKDKLWANMQVSLFSVCQKSVSKQKQNQPLRKFIKSRVKR